MSGTETRDADTWDVEPCCGHGLRWHHMERGCGYHGFSQNGCPCALTFPEVLDRRDARYLATAHTENDRLRGVVEAVQALADECAGSGCVHLNEMWGRLIAALASVPSSGQSETHVEIGGQRMTEAQFEAARRPLLDGVASAAEADRLREVWGRSDWDGSEDSMRSTPVLSSGEAGERRCDSCNGGGRPLRFSPEHGAHFCDACFVRENAAPAPVVSGGQADGEGEHLFVRDLRRHPNGEVRLYDDGRLISGTFAYQVLPDLAARPVLSREALRERLDGHWPSEPTFGTLVCSCTRWRADERSSRPRADQWRDHLAAVLVGQEER
jgi:hypothetical protein